MVSDNANIIEVRGDVRRYLGLSSGSANYKLFRFSPPGMHRAIETVIEAANASTQGSSHLQFECLLDGALRAVSLRSMSILRTSQDGRLFLVVFADYKPDRGSSTPEGAGDSLADARRVDLGYVAALELELHTYKERLEQAIDDREISLDDAKCMSQEAQENHEELQSLIEEMETSKEEVQSSNEELTVVNQELNDRMSDLEQIQDELESYLNYGEACALSVDSRYCISRFSHTAARVFELDASSRGRSLSVINRYLRDCEITSLVTRALEARQRCIEMIEHIDGYILEVIIQPIVSPLSAQSTVGIILFSILGSRPREDEHLDDRDLVTRLEKNWLFSGYGVAIVTQSLVGVWANLAFYSFTKERRENFVSQDLESGPIKHLFGSKFRDLLAEFARSDNNILRSHEIKQTEVLAGHLHAINVHKIPRPKGHENLFRITFEESHYE